MEKREVSMEKQKEIPGRRKSQRGIGNAQSDPDPVEHTMEGKKRILLDGIVRRRPTTANVIMAPLKTPLRRW